MFILLTAIYGVLIGNYVTSAYFRIPLTLPINGILQKHGKKPHCSVCGHTLKFYEYFPVLSWIFSRFNCNYCNTAIDKNYFIIEISLMLLSLVCLGTIGFNNHMIFVVLVIAALILNIFLFIKHKKFFQKALGIMLISIIIFSLNLYFELS